MAYPAHPGELVREWMEGHKATATATAKRLGLSRATFNRLLAGQGRMTAAVAVALEDMGWSQADFWMALQSGYDIARVRRELEAA